MSYPLKANTSIAPLCVLGTKSIELQGNCVFTLVFQGRPRIRFNLAEVMNFRSTLKEVG
jgi:hypothetical protein